MDIKIFFIKNQKKSQILHSRFDFWVSVLESTPSSVPFWESRTFLGSVLGFYEESLFFPQYPLFLSIFLDFLRFFASFFYLKTLLVYFQVYFRSQEPSSVWFLVLPSCQEPFFGLCHGLFQRIQILTLRFHHRSIPPSYN